ncbi:GHKL domain-containing protein [Thomasclavelia sp.]|uniref:GHKL domain-containing protein n=1 Tax=Thomasclavelia sp. TaxID=3025757 RepID=UPI0025E626EB|nr:GHKL domain-containing protein [Thomasclavelia sp.]
MNIIISIFEGLLISRFTSITCINQNRTTVSLIIYTLVQCMFSYLAFYYNFDSFLSTAIIVISYTLFCYDNTLNSLINSIFLGFTLNILILIANSFALIINYTSYFLFSTYLPFFMMLIVSKLLLWLLVEVIGKLTRHTVRYDNSKINLFNLSILLLTLLYALFFDGYFKGLIQIQYFLINITILSLLVIVIYRLFENHKRNLIYRTNQKILEKEIDFQKTNFKNLIANENETRKIRHNNKHLLLLLKEYTDKKDLDNIEKTLNDQLKNIDDLKYSINTGNESINFIVSHYLPLIKNNQIDLICNYFDGRPNIDKLDFYLIFGNILENAIEPCDSNKIKKIIIEAGKTPDGRYYFKIMNTINTMDKIDLLVSRKNTINHGFGITSINQLVSKNNGVVEFIQLRRNFSVIVILPI